MRLFLRPVLLLALFAVPLVAHAGERRHLGVMLMTGASITNLTTAVPFNIPANAKLTIVCTGGGAQILTDSKTVTVGTTGTKGLTIVAGERFPTSVSENNGAIGNTPTALIAMIGTAAVPCDVWQRLGTE